MSVESGSFQQIQKIRETLPLRYIQALNELCHTPRGYPDLATYNWTTTYRAQAHCNPRTFPISTDVEGLEESIIRSVTDEIAHEFPTPGNFIDPESDQALKNFLYDNITNLEIYRDAVHSGLVFREVEGVVPRMDWRFASSRRYNEVIITYDITNLGAQIVGYLEGVYHDPEMHDGKMILK